MTKAKVEGQYWFQSCSDPENFSVEEKQNGQYARAKYKYPVYPDFGTKPNEVFSTHRVDDVSNEWGLTLTPEPECP